MEQQTAPMNESNGNSGPLYMALELSKSKWRLAFTVGLGQKPRERTLQVSEIDRLPDEIDRARRRFGLAPDAPVRSCHEAGRDGFWVHRWLVKNGIENVVIDSSSIQVDRRARRAKSDGIDVRELANLLFRHHNGEKKAFSVLCVPSPEDEDARHLHRDLKSLKQERTRLTNRIKSLLATQRPDVEVLGPAELLRLDVDKLPDWDGKPLLEGFKMRLSASLARLELTHRQILAAERARALAIRESDAPVWELVRLLMTLKGIGENSAVVFVMEFFGWRKFQNRRQVGALAGLAPTPFQSGKLCRELGITKAGNRLVRSVAVEIAWSWLRLQPTSELSRWFAERFAAGGPRARKVGITAVARKILILLWRYTETGELPEGVELKA